MRKIPKKLRNKLSNDPYYNKCCLTGKRKGLQWHHSFKYAGKQINERWNIMPIYYKKHHWYGDKDSVHNLKETEEYVKYLALQRADLDDLEKRYPKKDWKQIYKHLKKYANQTKW